LGFARPADRTRSAERDTLWGMTPPPWLLALVNGHDFDVRDGILRAPTAPTASQAQTAAAFGFKWHQRDSFESEMVLRLTRDYLNERYGPIATAPWWEEYGPEPLVIDAGCGAGLTALAMLEPLFPHIRYLGIDISDAVDVAAERFRSRGLPAAFMQADFTKLPLPSGIANFVLAEGTLHHTDNTQNALGQVSRLLAPGGRFAFYIYRVKAPTREFTDDYIRHQLQEMTPEQAWEAMKPLTKLGIALGELGAEVDIPEDIELLGIPAGRHDVQRLFYWYICKAYHRPEFTFEEDNHINYDWFAPANAYRHTEDEVHVWCEEAGLTIEREVVQPSGITIVARRA
jgi:arsenite methyltransferase